VGNFKNGFSKDPGGTPASKPGGEFNNRNLGGGELQLLGRVPASQQQLIALLSKLTQLAHAMQVDDVKKPLYCVPYVLAEQAVYDALLQMKTPEETEQFANLVIDAVSKGVILPRQTFEILAGVRMERSLNEDSKNAIDHVVKAILEKGTLEIHDVFHSTEHFVEMGYRTVWESREFLSDICHANQCTEADNKVMDAQSPLPLASCEVIEAAREFIEKNSGPELSPKPLVGSDSQLWEDDAYRYVQRVTAIMHGVHNFDDVPVHDLEEGALDRRYFHVEPKGGSVPIELLVDYKLATRGALDGKVPEIVAWSKTGKLASAMASRICEIARAEAMELEAIAGTRPEDRGVYPVPVGPGQIGITDTPDEVFLEKMGLVLGKRFIEIKQALSAEIVKKNTLTAFNQLSAEELYALFAMKRTQLFDFCAPVHDEHFQLGLCAYRMRELLGDCGFHARETMKDSEKRAELVANIEKAIGMCHTTNDSFAFTIFGDGKEIRNTVQMINFLNAIERGGFDSEGSVAEEKSKGINTLYYLWNGLYDEQELNSIIRIEKPQMLQDIYQCKKVRFTESNINEAIRRGHFILDLIPERADQFTKNNMLVLVDEYLKPLVTRGKRLPRMFGYYPPEQEKLVRTVAFMEAMSWITCYLGDKVDAEVAAKFAELGIGIQPRPIDQQPAWTKFFRNAAFTTVFIDREKSAEGYLAVLQQEVRNRGGLSGLVEKLRAFNAQNEGANDPDSRALAKISSALKELEVLGPGSILPSTNPARPPTLDRHMPMLQNGAMNAFVRSCPGIYLESQCSGSETVYAVIVDSELAKKEGDGFRIDEKELISRIRNGDWAIYRVNENGFVSDIPRVYELLSGNSKAAQELDAITQEWRERFAALMPGAFPLKLKLVSYKPNEFETVSARAGKVNFKDSEPSLTFIAKMPHGIADMFEEVLGKHPRLLEAAASVPEPATATVEERKVFEAYMTRLALPDDRNPWLEFHGKADDAG